MNFRGRIYEKKEKRVMIFSRVLRGEEGRRMSKNM